LAKRDCYEVLGVSRDASQDAIKKAYRKLALAHHPDKTQGDKASEEKFKEATGAYQILSDDSNRQKYDQFGHAAFDGAGQGGFGDFSGFAEEIFGDIFGAFFGNAAGGSRRGRPGRDLRYNLEVTLEESAAGCEKEILLPKLSLCQTCSGTGAKAGTSAETCRQCNGGGQIRIQQGFFAISRPCNVCLGRGTVISAPCGPCEGGGRERKEVKLSVRIPAGIDEGQRLKIRGEGEVGEEGAPAGDLYVVIAIKEHPIFKRRETEVICEVPVSFTQAALGGEIEVPTLDGNLVMKIPPGTPSGKTFRLRGKGIIDIHSSRRGDQHVRTYVFVPKQLNARERELLEQLAHVEGKPTANESKSFFDKVKDFFD